MPPCEVLRLLLPEWQGYGLGAGVAHGARALAAQLFAGQPVVTIDAPDEEPLAVLDGVLGLSSIAPRFVRALDAITRASPDRILTVGGTCGVELAPIAYLNARYDGGLMVLWLDAHADLNTPASSPSAHFHGMVLRTLLGDGPAACTRAIARPLRPGQVVLAGVRELDPPERAFIDQASLVCLGPDAIRRPDALLGALPASSRLYVHCDVDVLDPERFPAALMRAPGGGLSLADLGQCLAALSARAEIVGMSVVEYRGHDAAWTDALADAVRRANVGYAVVTHGD